MSITEMYDIADRYEYLIEQAYEFGWNRKQLMDEIYQMSVNLREEADAIAEKMEAAYLEDQANEHAYYQQFA